MDYICNNCGTVYPKWLGKCNICGSWESITENKEPVSTAKNTWHASSQGAVDLSSVVADESNNRWVTNVSEFDSVIGGGIMPDSVGLLGGEPGIGKSTLILQLLGRLSSIGKKCLYISGEESINQIKNRADRLASAQSGLLVAVESELSQIFALINLHKPHFVVIDSIQTTFQDKINSSAGSIIQIRECTALITNFAKSNNCSFLIIAHVTKEGSIAGPKTIEHMVDYVLYLESTPNEDYRFLRALKNRYGTINELGFFKMTAQGLSEVRNPNRIFLENWKDNKSGSVIFPAHEGSRIMLIEVQALVSLHASNYASRTALGIERIRLLILIAILEKQLKINLSQLDVYVNITGGFRVTDPAIDMAVISAIYSSLKNIAFKQPIAMVGEALLFGLFTEAKNSKDKLSILQQSGIAHCFYYTNKPISSTANYINVNSVIELTKELNKFI